jgi:BASS family bile acid:Na+ symporter
VNPRMIAIARSFGWLRHNLLALVIVSYVLAAAFPGVGHWIKDAQIPRGPRATICGNVSISAMLLGFLLFSAGLRVEGARIRAMVRRPTIVLAGLLANLLMPLLYLLVLIPILGRWHNPDEMATILVGLALVAAMPVAGSSTGWAQHADGDMALSLTLVVASTLLSPITAPLVLQSLQIFSPPHAALDLDSLAGRDTSSFLTVWVLAPSLAGILLRSLTPRWVTPKLERACKPLANVALLILCYSNASACLPQVLGQPDWDFLVIALLSVAGLCVSMFGAGFFVARVLRGNRHERAALIFGLGMNNNGTGMVLASAALASRPLAILPIIVYNLAQHVAAGCVDSIHRRSAK